MAETNAEGCSVLAGESYYYEYSGNCLIPLTATCEAVEEEGFEQLGSVGPCSVTTTETADDVINAEAGVCTMPSLVCFLMHVANSANGKAAAA